MSPTNATSNDRPQRNGRPSAAPATASIRVILGRALPRAGRTIRMLLKLILPISLGVAVLRWTGALAAIGHLFAPSMALFRLPGEAAVALVSGFLGGIYALAGAMAVIPLTPVQVTVICSIALVAHNLIVECTVQDKAGTPWWWMLSARLLSGVVIGLAVAWPIHFLESLHLPALWLRVVRAGTPSALPAAAGAMAFLRGWAHDAASLTIKLVLIVTAMMVVTEWIRAKGILNLLERSCRPLLRFFGLRDPVAYAWITAQILGVAYGSGLIIEEMREDRDFRPRDVRALHTSIGLSHSVFEDTILLAALGASIFWIIVPRVLWAALAVRLAGLLPYGLRESHQGRSRPGGKLAAEGTSDDGR